MRILLFSLILTMGAVGPAAAQEAATSGSGSGTGGNVTLDWSVGELTLVSTVQNGSLVLTQGLLQGWQVAIPRVNGIAPGELIVFPNPTHGAVFVQTGFFEPGQLMLALYDAQGKLLVQLSDGVASFGTGTMDLSRYASGVYFLHAIFKSASGDTRDGTFKITRL